MLRSALKSRIAVTLSILGSGACGGGGGGSSATAPTAPTTQYSIRGSVGEYGSSNLNQTVPIGSVALTVLDGLNSGKSATTDSGGQYSIADLAPGGFSVRASREGYQAQDKRVQVPAQLTLNFVMIRNCEPWPQQVQDMMARLPLPEGLCLVRMPSSESSNYVSAQRVVYLRAPSPVGGEVYAIGHELCHARQHRVLIDAGLGDPAHDGEFIPRWIATPEGMSFLEITGWQFKGGSPTNADSWVRGCEPAWESCTFQNPVEDNAEVCATFYNPAGTWPRNALERFAPLRARWAAQWLPR